MQRNSSLIEVVHDQKLWAIGWAFLIMSSCAFFSSVEKPPWLRGESEFYPSDRYLVGVGRGTSASLAEERAYAAVAKIFSAHVQSRVEDTEKFRLVEKADSRKTSRELALAQSTRVTTNKVLQNVQVLDRWIHPETKEWYVLAGLDRRQVEPGLIERIQEYDRRIQDDVDVARTSVDKLVRVRKLRDAIHAWHEREAANQDLRVIRTSGRGLPAPFRLSELIQELDAFLHHHFLIKVDIQGEYGPDVQSAIVQRLREEGLAVSSKTTAPANHPEMQGFSADQQEDLLIRGNVHVWDIETRDPLFVYARWCGTIHIAEPNQQRLVGIVNQSGREGHVTSAEARRRAASVMQKTMAQAVSKALFDSLQRESSEKPHAPLTPCINNQP